MAQKSETTPLTCSRFFQISHQKSLRKSVSVVMEDVRAYDGFDDGDDGVDDGHEAASYGRDLLKEEELVIRLEG